ncbi:MAG: tetratricopeptide repeat protein, partial [Candidatus Cloacimonadota bacterium]|nr:tetratricopeptide repeat protein [Candidatus Cloacimonadota bacterium]
MDLRENGKPSRNAIKKYNKVIKKCGKIITNHKDSKYVDDSVFLIGKCKFYKNRGFTGAIEKFDELIKFYPDSPFVNEAHLYLAKSLHKNSNRAEATEYLNNLLENYDLVEVHPQALKLLSEFSEFEEDIEKQKLFLQRIIDNYPESEIYNSAYFDLAIIEFNLKNYQESFEHFTELVNKKIAKEMELNCKYYIALNSLKLENTEFALETIDKLIKKESLQEKITRDEILKARILEEKESYEASISLYKDIINNNEKTKFAAESSYYLADLYFLKQSEYDLAIENYKAVKTQFRKSEFVEKAVSKSAIVSQIVQYQNPSNLTASEDMVDEQFKLAEYYFDILNAPDSADVVYDKILNQEDYFIKLRTTIIDSLENLPTKSDSLRLVFLNNKLTDLNYAKKEST